MKPKKVQAGIRLDPVLKRKLQLISLNSRGKPPVAGLVAEALEQYIERVFAEDPALRAKVMTDLAPRVAAFQVVGGAKKGGSI